VPVLCAGWCCRRVLQVPHDAHGCGSRGGGWCWRGCACSRALAGRPAVAVGGLQPSLEVLLTANAACNTRQADVDLQSDPSSTKGLLPLVQQLQLVCSRGIAHGRDLLGAVAHAALLDFVFTDIQNCNSKWCLQTDTPCPAIPSPACRTGGVFSSPAAMLFMEAVGGVLRVVYGLVLSIQLLNLHSREEHCSCWMHYVFVVVD